MAKWKNALLISTIVAPVAFGAGPIGNALADAVNSIGTKPTKTDVTITKMLNTKEKKTNYYWGNGLTLAENKDTTSFTAADGWKKAGADYEFTAFRLPDDVIKGYESGDKPKVSDAYVVDDATIYDGDGVNHFGSYDADTKTYTVTAGDRASYATATGTPYASIATMTWKQAIGVETPAAGGPINAGGKAKSAYTFELKLTAGTQIEQFQTYLGTKSDNQGNMGTGDNTAKAGYQLKTDADTSSLTFEDLVNDEWVIFETANPSGSEKVEMAVPMVLNLPMVQPDGTAWFGDTTDGKKAINLYPKNFILNGDLTVHKQDVDDKAVAGADFILIDGLADGAADGIDKVAAAITAGTKYNVGTSEKPVEKTIVEMSTAETIALLTKSVAAGGFGLTIVDPDGTPGGNQYVTTAATTGDATFTNIKPDYTYYTMETSTPDPEKYDEIGTIQKIETTTDVKDEYDVNEDGKVYFTGGKYSVRNLPTTIIDKKIAVDSQMDTSSSTPSSSTDMQIFQDNDYVTGVSRGEHFQYKVDAAFDKYLTGNVQPGDNTLANQNGYNKFVIDDTFYSAIDITSFQIGTTVNGVYTPLYLVDLTVDGKDQSVDGGFSGDGGTYVPKIYDMSQPLEDGGYVDVTDALESYITISGEAAVYSNPNSQTITGTPGELKVALTAAVNGTSDTIPDFSGNAVAQKFVSTLTQSDKSYSTGSVTLVMNAQTNSAAAVGQLNNNAKLTSQTVNGTPNTPSDDSKTFNAGWEFVKTDADSAALEGAGFDLSRKLASGDQLTQKDRLLNEASGIMNLREDGNLTDAAITALAKLAAQFGTGTDWYLGANGGTQDEKDLHDALVTYLGLSKDAQAVVANQTPVAEAMVDVLNGQLALIQANRASDLYFAHLDKAGLPVESMTMTKEMGDVLWTPYKALATTHYTNDQGYFQYCGLAMGPYTLTETVVPSGFDKVDDINFFIGDQELMKNTTLDSNGNITSANPYKEGTEEAKAWDKTVAAYNTAHAAGFTLLNGKWSDNAITGTEATPTLVSKAKNGEVVQVLNYEKSIFPLVGGIGALFAVIAGLLAMGLALLKRKKDMKNEA